MKLLFGFLLVVACVHANSLHRYGWSPGKESVYKFQSQVLHGIPDINKNQKAGLTLQSVVRVQSFSDYSLRIKIENPKISVLNEKVRLDESGRIIDPPNESQVPEEFRKYLEQPFLVHLKSGVVQSFKVDQEEPSGVTNIKRSVLSQLQLDIAGTQRYQMESNHIQFSDQVESELSSLSEDSHPTYFHTKEESIHGKCKTSYSVQKIPEYKAKEFEEYWSKKRMEMRGEWSSEPTPEVPFCNGKPYYQIVKNKDFDECETSPIFQKWTGVSGKCNLAQPSTCVGLLLSLSSTTYVTCGELSEYQIINVKTENIIKSNPLAFSTDESIHSNTLVSLELVKVNPITERLPLPQQMKNKDSIIYAFPKQEELKQKIPQEIKEISKEILGIEPILPQPNLEEPPQILVPLKTPKSEVMSQIKQLLEKMASEVAQSPESCSSKSDIAGTFLSVSNYLRTLSLSEFKQLQSEICQESSQQLKPVEKLFWDTISAVGTNPSTMLVIRKIKEGSLPTRYAVYLIQHAIRNVRYPTQELLNEFVSLAQHQTVKSNKYILSVILPNLSLLFYRAYVNPSTMINNFPGQIYGAFGSKHSPSLTEKYIPYLIRIAKAEESGLGSASSKQHLQYSAIIALGKTGHLKAAETLLKFAEGKLKPIKSETEAEPLEAKLVRPLAVYNLKWIVKMNPPQMKPLLMALIENPVEAPEVRASAVAILPFAQPTPNDIQNLALRTWFEPSRQVANFIRSTFHSLVNTEVPEWKPLSGFVKVSLPLMKPHDFGYIYARNMQFNKFVEYLQTGVVGTFQLQQSKKAMVPTRIFGGQTYHGQQGAFKLEGGEWTTYMQGMDELVEKYVKYYTYAAKTTGQTKQVLNQIVEQLNLKTREYKKSQFYGLYYALGLYQDLYLDSETVMETLDKISDKINQGKKSYHFNMVSATMWQFASALATTDAGFPIFNTLALPMVLSAKGHFKATGLPDLSEGPKALPEFEASIVPVFNFKGQSTMEIVSPFTKQVLGTGVEASLHSSIPIEVKAKVEDEELKVTIKTPSENTGRETETLHGFVLPFNFIKPAWQVKPVTRADSFKKLLSGTPHSSEMDIGRSLGLSAKLRTETNNIYYDFASYVEKIRQAPVSNPLILLVPSSVRYSSTRITYNPGQSETKELLLRVKVKSQGSPVFPGKINEGDIDPEFNSVRSVLKKIESSHGSATLISFTASTNRHHHHSTKSCLIVGKGSSPANGYKIFTALNFKIGESETYSIKYEGETSFTNLKNLWKLDQLVQEDLEGKITAKLQFGQGEENETVLKGYMKKSEEQKRAVQESPEYKKCQHEVQEGRKLSPTCNEARLQAASLDEFKFQVERYPSSLAKSSIVRMIRQVVESMLIGQITYNKGSESSQAEMKIKFERTGHVAQASVKLPSGEQMKIKNVRLCGYVKNLLPFPIHASIGHSLRKAVSHHHAPYTCTVEPESITTFDNKTFGYKLNDCEHLLLQDGGKKLPVAVLAKSVQSGEKKQVRIISGEVEAKVVPQGESVSVKINNAQVEVPTGQVKVIKSSHGEYPVVEIKKYEEGTFWLNFPQQGLEVLADGKRVEILSSGLLWSRAVGLCGDMNGESSADLKSPQKCVMTPKIGAVSYILEKQGGSCQGIPPQFKEQYEREAQKCSKEHVYPTPLEKIYEDKEKNSTPQTRAHIVEKMPGKTCISKKMVNICKVKPGEVKYKTLQFACIPRPSVEAETLEKRARAGEPLEYIVNPMPTSFSKTRAEPMSCRF